LLAIKQPAVVHNAVDNVWITAPESVHNNSDFGNNFAAHGWQIALTCERAITALTTS
jgi:hypothetical protein